MDITKQITRQKQIICREEKSLAAEKLKKRRAETRRKIELGGLVVKAGMDAYNKAVILGVLNYINELLSNESKLIELFEQNGSLLFMDKLKN
ncbi:conjugal transfer protein TraD [Legionella sp. 16cNR16C]|uniref:conjugal transfer protein TraD n=1 Tax=Legionella sp. 16cNR16C TaxID=2905656 RepID=UPI001E3EFB87|nr:conjugal transfer protein TraD [Legionella sp. 16cNR16C]MCE3043963.1 conjugal transfer protein TraD [Legionella sp. 16cNR16C]